MPLAGKGRAAWRDLVPLKPGVFIAGFQPFDKFIGIEERSGGNKRLRLLSNSGKSDFVASEEPAYTMGLGINEEPGSSWLRYTYTSLTTPVTTYEVNAATGERRVLKVQPVPGYDASKYVTERVWAPARDGTKFLFRSSMPRSFSKDGSAAMLQYGYGSYGSSSDPTFSVSTPSLLDRGMVYAIAHVRGGQEMGRKWYDDGHLMHKTNSFTDFIDVTRYLVAQRLCCEGSRGGAGRQRRRAADGRRRQHGAAGLPRDRGAGAVRRRRHDDARREHSADHQRI